MYYVLRLTWSWTWGHSALASYVVHTNDIRQTFIATKESEFRTGSSAKSSFLLALWRKQIMFVGQMRRLIQPVRIFTTTSQTQVVVNDA